LLKNEEEGEVDAKEICKQKKGGKKEIEGPRRPH